MRKKRIFTTTLIVLILFVGIASLILYKLGDTIFDEVIDNQIEELEAAVEQTELNTQSPADPSINTPKASDKQLQQQNSPNHDRKQNPTQPISKTPTSTSIPQSDSSTPAKSQPKESMDPNMQLTKDKLESMKQSVTPADKMSAAAMVLNKLSQSDIDTLTRLAANGITSEEKEQMKAIVYARFTQEEIRQIKAMYVKYMNN